MKFRLGPRTRRAVSMYIEAFILIAIAMAGSILVYAAATGLAASGTGGASVSISYATIRQGTNAAIEKVTIANTGTVTITSFALATVGVISSATCYLSLFNLATGSTTSPACSFTGPVSSGTVTVAPGQSVVATLTVEASLFTVGTLYTVTVSTSSAAQAVQRVVATSA